MEAEAIAGVGVGKVGGVLSPGDVAGCKVGFELGLGSVEERAEQGVLPAHGLHRAGRREAAAPLPSGEAHEHGFEDVFFVVGQEDGI